MKLCATSIIIHADETRIEDGTKDKFSTHIYCLIWTTQVAVVVSRDAGTAGVAAIVIEDGVRQRSAAKETNYEKTKND